MLRSIAMTFAVLAVSAANAAGTQLRDFSFWRVSEGWWTSDNTYFDHNLDYNIRSYNSVIHIELDGGNYRETEIKSYAPSKLAMAYGDGRISADEGIETVTVTTGELTDEAGTVRFVKTLPEVAGSAMTQISILTQDTAVRVTSDPLSGFDAYRMFITMPAPDKRYIANFGLVSANMEPGSHNAAPAASIGDLRGFSLFRGNRIAAADAEKWRQEYRARNKVAAIVDVDAHGNKVIRRLDGR